MLPLDDPRWAALPDAFSGSDLDAQLRSRAVRELRLLGRPGSAQLGATANRAAQLGYVVETLERLPQ